jgi:hypothetical protein
MPTLSNRPRRARRLAAWGGAGLRDCVRAVLPGSPSSGELPLLGTFLFAPCAGILAGLFGLMVFDSDGRWIHWGPVAVVSAWALVALYGTTSVGPHAGMPVRWTLTATTVVFVLYAALLWWIVGGPW